MEQQKKQVPYVESRLRHNILKCPRRSGSPAAS